MPDITYTQSDINTVKEKIGGIETKATNVSNSVSSLYSGLDARIVQYYSDYFGPLDTLNESLNDQIPNAPAAKDWIDNTDQELQKLKNSLTTEDPNSTYDPNVDKNDPGNGTTDKYGIYNVNPLVDKLSEKEKEAVVKKLKALGYSDEEIEKNLNGGFTVPKATLDAVTSEIAKLDGDKKTEISKYVQEKYGFDIFDKDGNIDPNKLALILEMDRKNPKDDYDFIKLLKEKYGIDIQVDEYGNLITTPPATTSAPTVTPYTTAPTTSPEGTTSTTAPQTVLEHNGESYSGDNDNPSGPNGGSADQAIIDDIINGDSENNGKEGSLIDGIATSFGKIIPKGGISGSEGSSAGGAATAVVAGLGAAAVAAGGGLLIKKKMDENGEDEDEDEKEDDELEKEENEFDEEMKQMEEEKEESGNKDWLYGLGIGLAGAGIAAGLMGDDDDDEDEEDDDDIDLL